MKILAYCILHYGRPYLHAAVESLYDQVDEIVFLYSPAPSQGYRSETPCPDQEEQLRAEVKDFEAKIKWVTGYWNNEGDHTNAIWPLAEGFDWVWRFDADEVVPPGIVAEMIAQAAPTPEKIFCVPFVHFWRTFSRCCRDAQMPVRLTRMEGGGGQRYLDSGKGKWFVYHFGYAQPTQYIWYKLQVSAHKPEFRPTWYYDRWLAIAQKDLHPVNFPDFWNAEDFDITTMPEVLKRHENYGKSLIE